MLVIFFHALPQKKRKKSKSISVSNVYESDYETFLIKVTKKTIEVKRLRTAVPEMFKTMIKISLSYMKYVFISITDATGMTK